MLGRLLAFMTILPMAELFVTLGVHGLVADRFGQRDALAFTLGMIVLTGVAGAILARWQGVAAVRAIRSSLARGEMPGRQLMDAALIVVGGALLLTPGYLSDLIGITMMVPWTRAVYRRRLADWLRRKVEAGKIRAAGRPGEVVIDVTDR